MACADVATAKAKAAKAINLIISSLPVNHAQNALGGLRRLVAPCCPPRDTRDANRRQGAANCGLGTRDESRNAWNRELLAELKARRATDRDQ
jgi:hypothetical protein